MMKLSKITALLCAVSSFAYAATPSLDSSLQTTLDKYRSKAQIPGAALSVKLPGATGIQDYYSGNTAKGGTDAITKDSLFQIGGVSKSFTAAVVLQLEAEGKLSLDDKLSKWMPQLTDWKDISLRQLLNETSGIFDYLAIHNFVNQLSNPTDASQANQSTKLLLDDLVAMAYQHKPNMSSKSGARWVPCNTNYALLGLVIQKVTGHAFAEEMNQRLLGSKLGLMNTYYFPYPQTAMDHMTHGYEADGVTDVSRFDMSWSGPAAGLISTAHDMAQWSQALFGGQVLQPQQLKEMTSLVSMKNGQALKAGNYSMGVGLGIESGVDALASSYGIVYGYSGNTLGYRAQFVYLPCYDTVVAVTVNNVGVNDKDLTGMVGDVVKAVMKSSDWADYKKSRRGDQLPVGCKR